CAASGGRLDLQFSAAGFGSSLEQRDTQSDAAGAAAGCERVNDLLESFCVHAFTVVDHAQAQAVGVQILLNGDLDHRRACSQAVLGDIQEVERNLSHGPSGSVLYGPGLSVLDSAQELWEFVGPD